MFYLLKSNKLLYSRNIIIMMTKALTVNQIKENIMEKISVIKKDIDSKKYQKTFIECNHGNFLKLNASRDMKMHPDFIHFSNETNDYLDIQLQKHDNYIEKLLKIIASFESYHILITEINQTSLLINAQFKQKINEKKHLSIKSNKHNDTDNTDDIQNEHQLKLEYKSNLENQENLLIEIISEIISEFFEYQKFVDYSFDVHTINQISQKCSNLYSKFLNKYLNDNEQYEQYEHQIMEQNNTQNYQKSQNFENEYCVLENQQQKDEKEYYVL